MRDNQTVGSMSPGFIHIDLDHQKWLVKYISSDGSDVGECQLAVCLFTTTIHRAPGYAHAGKYYWDTIPEGINELCFLMQLTRTRQPSKLTDHSVVAHRVIQ
jgi:hypothetical protein